MSTSLKGNLMDGQMKIKSTSCNNNPVYQTVLKTSFPQVPSPKRQVPNTLGPETWHMGLESRSNHFNEQLSERTMKMAASVRNLLVGLEIKPIDRQFLIDYAKVVDFIIETELLILLHCFM